MSTTTATILDAVRDEKLLRPFLGDLRSWWNWLIALRVLYGLPLINQRQRDLVRETTGRDPAKLPREGFRTALFLTGRRCGKSRIASLIGAYEGCLAGNELKLAKGETGLVAVVSPTRDQSKVITRYTQAVFQTPLLQAEIIADQREGFTLSNGIRIQTLAGDWRTTRNYTLVAVIVEEAAFLGMDEESKVRSDTELIRALQPGLATTQGKLIAISSPYAKKGWCYKQYQRHFGNDRSNVLVWNCPSRIMNPTLDQKIVDAAIEDDPEAARSEYLGQFREDMVAFLPREVIESCVVSGRTEIYRDKKQTYRAFVDLSGGRADDAAMAIGHREERKVVIDLLRAWKSPLVPFRVIEEMARELRKWGLNSVTGDNYAAEFVSQAFRGQGILYTQCEKPKSSLYLELLPRICSNEIELLDDEVLIAQLASLERRTRSGGKDAITHPNRPGARDDVANAVAGVADMLFQHRSRIGALFED